MDARATTPPPTRTIAAWSVVSAGVSTAVLLSAQLSSDPLGAPAWWSWLLTGGQIVALWAAGTGRAWGWIVGSAVQPPWIAYAVLTGQFGFVPGCAVSAAVQTASFVRDTRPSASRARGATVRRRGRLDLQDGTRVATSGSTHAPVRDAAHAVTHHLTRSAR